MDYGQVVSLLSGSVRSVEAPEHKDDKEITWRDAQGKVVATGYDYRSNRQPKCSDVSVVGDSVSFDEGETAYLVTLGKR